MRFRVAAFTLGLALAAAPAVFASGKKETKASVTVFLQAENTDNPKMVFPEGGAQMANGQRVFFSRMPELSTKDFQSFNPFPSDAGDYGMVVKMKGAAINRYAAITAAYQGKWMISQVNGRAVDAVLIDKQVTDGIIVIWKGVTLADIAILDESMPRIGEEGKKKKKKKPAAE